VPSGTEKKPRCVQKRKREQQHNGRRREDYRSRGAVSRVEKARRNGAREEGVSTTRKPRERERHPRRKRAKSDERAFPVKGKTLQCKEAKEHAGEAICTMLAPRDREAIPEISEQGTIAIRCPWSRGILSRKEPLKSTEEARESGVDEEACSKQRQSESPERQRHLGAPSGSWTQSPIPVRPRPRTIYLQDLQTGTGGMRRENNARSKEPYHRHF